MLTGSKFRKENLPRIIFHNPDLQINILLEDRVGGSAPLTIHKGVRSNTDSDDRREHGHH